MQLHVIILHLMRLPEKIEMNNLFAFTKETIQMKINMRHPAYIIIFILSLYCRIFHKQQIDRRS